MVTSINSVSPNEASVFCLRLFWHLADIFLESYSSERRKVVYLDLNTQSLKLLLLNSSEKKCKCVCKRM